MRLPAGTPVFAEHQPCQGFPLLIEGSIRVIKLAANGRELMLYRVTPGGSCIISSSCLLGHTDYNARGIAIQQKHEATRIDEMIKALRVKVSAPDVEVTALSGGNQQKVVIGKSLLTKPKLLLLDEPTRGIDIGAKAEVFKTMRQLAEEGLGVVFATSDLKEIMSAADRILVMSRGLVTGDFPRSEATERKLVAASTMTEADLVTNHETARSSEEPLTPITEH